MIMACAGIALGSNLGDRLAHLQNAITCLRNIATVGQPILIAPIYQTEPRFCPPGSPDFLNTVIEIQFHGSALDLLEKTQNIERNLGRAPNPERNAPRIIDIDLLYFGDECMHHESLILPHPRICERRFVLQPLADIRPHLILPGHSHTIAAALQTIITDEAPLQRIPSVENLT
ncbi:MAG: 2-amino-4-hydroxy-6-hydroxymethyldihydropteridine diphosphokinase [Gloeobacteraceae cyanobacterium ES-bin-144]|nr:2-amino-4-hydroxy-6-hydroxymethyldihydropteridine diphosphokinase [Verrucomicrobiales bacterium]